MTEPQFIKPEYAKPDWLTENQWTWVLQQGRELWVEFYNALRGPPIKRPDWRKKEKGVGFGGWWWFDKANFEHYLSSVKGLELPEAEAEIPEEEIPPLEVPTLRIMLDPKGGVQFVEGDAAQALGQKLVRKGYQPREDGVFVIQPEDRAWVEADWREAQAEPEIPDVLKPFLPKEGEEPFDYETATEEEKAEFYKKLEPILRPLIAQDPYGGSAMAYLVDTLGVTEEVASDMVTYMGAWQQAGIAITEAFEQDWAETMARQEAQNWPQQVRDKYIADLKYDAFDKFAQKIAVENIPREDRPAAYDKFEQEYEVPAYLKNQVWLNFLESDPAFAASQAAIQVYARHQFPGRPGEPIDVAQPYILAYQSLVAQGIQPDTAQVLEEARGKAREYFLVAPEALEEVVLEGYPPVTEVQKSMGPLVAAVSQMRSAQEGRTVSPRAVYLQAEMELENEGIENPTELEIAQRIQSKAMATPEVAELMALVPGGGLSPLLGRWEQEWMARIESRARQAAQPLRAKAKWAQRVMGTSKQQQREAEERARKAATASFSFEEMQAITPAQFEARVQELIPKYLDQIRAEFRAEPPSWYKTRGEVVTPFTTTPQDEAQTTWTQYLLGEFPEAEQRFQLKGYFSYLYPEYATKPEGKSFQKYLEDLGKEFFAGFLPTATKPKIAKPTGVRFYR